MTEKIKIKSIFVDRAEGLSSEVAWQKLTANQSEEKQNIFNIINEALNAWSISVRPDSTDKTDFILTWENGKTYGGTLPLRFGYNNLSEHIRSFLKFYVQKPSHLEKEQWEQYIYYTDRRDPEFIPKCKDFLENYQLE